jgi:hypothetical protein
MFESEEKIFLEVKTTSEKKEKIAPIQNMLLGEE